MLDPQLKRGMLEICILAALRDEDSYGYELIRKMENCVSVSESTLYPILRRLESAGSLSVYTVEHNFRLRKMYRLTERGRERIAAFLDGWPEVMKMYDYIREVGS